MTDLHTHILPGMDDGAESVEEAITLLRAQVQQGVDTVALTPHYYRDKETVPEFLARREAACSQLQEAMGDEEYPKIILGAEVAWSSRMTEWSDLEALCYENTRTLLVELPVTPWQSDLFRQLYSLEGRLGIIPMIAHVERYFHFQKKKDMERLLELGYPMQVSAAALFHIFDRKRAVELLEQYDGILISDCHNTMLRCPNMGDALQLIEKKKGQRLARQIAELTDDILMD